MTELTHYGQREGRTITFRWLAEQAVVLNRVYALAFTRNGQMLLVGERSNPDYWLPGGGIEPGESAEVALARELVEEAAATIEHLGYLGAQRVDDPLKETEHHGFYWCRVRLADVYVPELEVNERLLVPPERFLDTIFWGRTDPKAALLLRKALHANRMTQPPAEPTPARPSE